LIPLILNALGRGVALVPEPLLEAFSAVAGEAILWLAPRRRRVLRSNLHHAFPDKPRAWRRRVARLSSRRLVETGLLSLAAPYLSERRIRAMAHFGPDAAAYAESVAERHRPTLFATLHFALWESQAWYRLISPSPTPATGIIFRPLDNPALNAFILKTRSRFGMRLLSRKEGFVEAMTILRGGGAVAVLFDQNAGNQGALTLVLGRVCSTTELPGVLAVKCAAEVRASYPRRTGFWRMELESEAVESDGTAAGITLALNRCFERAVGREDLVASWLWAHDRWRNQDTPRARLRLSAKRNLLERDLEARGLSQLPRKTRVWIRMPNWLGDVVMALPLLRAIRASRPDAELTLLCGAGLAPFLESTGLADRVRALPPRGPGYFPAFMSLASQYPDVWILLTNSARGDLEARLAGCPQRFGIGRPGKWRPLLTHTYPVPDGLDEAGVHQVRLWEDFLRHFGLDAAPDFEPLSGTRTAGADAPIGLIAGSENTPGKRWPVGHWRELIGALPDRRFVLFGTAGDAGITAQIAEGLGPRVADRAGKTNLSAFAAELGALSLLVSNDTGGMHLANALGVPVVGLFGPTNPVRTGPVFRAPVRILQPRGCPPRGGAPLAGLLPAEVALAVRDLP
jgi:ADP-heptose:LPS heptosyltransferase/lauroyl/myristoyl acyltransferase